MNGTCGHEEMWWGCYGGTYDLWREESYAHPAKMSPVLCYRIFAHLKEMGLVDGNSIILDPLSYQKGNPVADCEDIIIATRG